MDENKFKVICKKLPPEGTFELDKEYYAEKIENSSNVLFSIKDNWDKEHLFRNWGGLNKYFTY